MAGETRQTRQLMRAQAAYICVLSLKQSVMKEETDHYAQLAKKFPALVHNCGLAQAVAFILAREGNIGKSYAAHLMQTMGEEGDIGIISRDPDLMKYRQLTREAIESATWLKRYSEALLETD